MTCPAPRLRRLFALLSEIPEYRKPRGIRYGLNTLLSIAVAARMAGCRDPQEQHVAVAVESQQVECQDLFNRQFPLYHIFIPCFVQRLGAKSSVSRRVGQQEGMLQVFA
ncbi:MAG: hypothetical protein OXE78_07075 [Gammaproteobacteria bacterium]|nr:hypothetical protein [Gammaproteobacteria bacterium]MCY4356419.1 hypothetical protein [Gammaproteobacteria bacterium]